MVRLLIQKGNRIKREMLVRKNNDFNIGFVECELFVQYYIEDRGFCVYGVLY